MNERRSYRALRYALLSLWLAVCLFPLYWIVSTSFKPPGEWLTWPPLWWPAHFTLANHLYVWANAHLSSIASASFQSPVVGLFNSAVVSIGAALLAVTLGSLAAYGISRFQTLGERGMFNLLSLRMMPPVVIAIPVVIYYQMLHFTDTWHGLILIYTVTTLPYAVWMSKSFIDEVPTEIEQAALLLGASRLRVFFTIIFPLIRSGLVVTFLFVLILNWSEFLFAFTLGYSDVQTAPVMLSKFEGSSEGRQYGPQAAMGIAVTWILVVIGFFIHKHLVRGFSFGMVRR